MMFRNGGLWGNGYGTETQSSANAQAMLSQSLGDIQSSIKSGEVQRERIATDVSMLAQTMGFNKDFIYSAIVNNGDKISNAIDSIVAAMNNDSQQTMNRLYDIGTQLQSGNANVINSITSAINQAQMANMQSNFQTQTAIMSGNNQIQNSILQSGFSNERAVTGAANDINSTLNQMAFGLQSGLNTSTNSLQSSLTQLGFAMDRGFCSVGREIDRNTSELALSNEKQTNALQTSIAGIGYLTQQGMNDIKYTIAKEACETRSENTANKNEILNWLSSNRINELQDKLNVARTEIATQSQTDALKEVIYATRYPVTSTSSYTYNPSSLYPNGSQSYPFYFSGVSSTATTA